MLTRTFFIHGIPHYDRAVIIEGTLLKLKEDGILLEVNSYCDVDNTGNYSISYTVKINDDTPASLQ